MIADVIKLGALYFLWQVLTAVQNAILAGYAAAG
jgi:hypothetical protein